MKKILTWIDIIIIIIIIIIINHLNFKFILAY